jgi:hypothetical protein
MRLKAVTRNFGANTLYAEFISDFLDVLELNMGLHFLGASERKAPKKRSESVLNPGEVVRGGGI